MYLISIPRFLKPGIEIKIHGLEYNCNLPASLDLSNAFESAINRKKSLYFSLM